MFRSRHRRNAITASTGPTPTPASRRTVLPFTGLRAAIMLAPLAAASPPPGDDLGAAPPCGDGQVVVTASPTEAAVTHRAVTLTSSLAPGAGPCTLTGYLGGLRGPTLPTITLSRSQPAHAVVEGDAVDARGDQCPTYTNLRVTPPDTETVTVPATIDSCELQVHPMGSGHVARHLLARHVYEGTRQLRR
jgi:hypothetical protein